MHIFSCIGQVLRVKYGSQLIHRGMISNPISESKHDTKGQLQLLTSEIFAYYYK